MSSKIDERVVQMKIDNGQFTKGISETTSALDNLKKALKFDDITKRLGELEAAGRNMKFAQNLGVDVDNVASKFTALQAVALGALATIGSKAADLGLELAQKLGQNMTRDISAGFEDYNSKLTSVQTIMNATGADIGTVEGYFGQLDTYADKTIYNLNDMTGAFAKFTNAGIGMEQSIPAIKGIGNMTALAGQGAGAASVAYFNLSQSLSKGFLDTLDYKSLQGANLTTVEWKNTMIDAAVAAGTLGKNADGTFTIFSDGSGKATTAAGLFTEELSRGWATADVLTGVLGNYADETTELGKKASDAAMKVKSLPMMMETLAAAAGTGWTDTFSIVLGNVTEATELFTFLTNEIGAFTENSAEARNSQLQLWKDMGGRDALVNALHNAFAALHGILDPIARAWAKVFPPSWGKTLAEISKAIEKFTAGLILSEGAQKNLEKVATVLFTILKFGVDVISGIARVIFNFVGIVFNLIGAIWGLISPVLSFLASLLPVKEGADDATSGVSGFFDMLTGLQGFLTGWLIDGLKNLGTMLNDFLNGEKATDRINRFKDAISGLVEVAAMVFNSLFKGDFTGNPFFQEDSAFVDHLFDIREACIKAVDAVKDFMGGVKEAADRASSFWGGMGKVIKAVWEYIKPIGEGIAKFFQDVMKNLDMDTILATVNTGVLIGMAVGIGKIIKKITGAFSQGQDIGQGLIDGLTGIKDTLKAWQNDLKADMLLKIAAAVLILSGALWILSTIEPERLISASVGLATAAGVLLGGMFILGKIKAEPSLKATAAIILIAEAINIMATAIVKIGALNPEQLTAGLIGVTVAMMILVVAAERLNDLDDGLVKSAFAMILMATAIVIVAGAVALFGIMPIEMLLQGMISVGIVLAGLVGAAVLLSKFAPEMVLSAVGLMAMAAALNMLIVPIIALGLLPFAILLQGMVSLGILLAGLVIAAILLNYLAPEMVLSAVGLMAMAFAIGLLVAPLIMLGMLPMDVLIQGMISLALVMGILVVAAMAMAGATVGAVGMVAMAGAILILAFALMILGSIGLENMAAGIIGLVAAIVIMAITAALLTPATAAMWAIAGVMAIFALGAIALAAAVVIFALGLMMLGPALTVVAFGVATIGRMSDSIMAAIGPMMAMGAAFLIFGAGAIVAGIGALLLGAGLIVLGAGLALIGAVGLIGAVALSAVVKSMMKLMEHVPGMLILGGTFLVLGAGVLVLGAGLAVLAIAMMLIVVALAMLVSLGPSTAVALALIGKAVEKLAPMAGEMATIAKALGKLADATTELAASGRAAASGLTAISTSFTTLATSSTVAANAMKSMSTVMTTSALVILTQLKTVVNGFQQFSLAVFLSIVQLNSGLTNGFGQTQAIARNASSQIVSALVGGIQSAYSLVYFASYNLGTQMIAGMNSGLQNGSYLVSAMARKVAQTALTAAKNQLGVASPSKEFAWIGKMSDEGLAKGLLGNVHLVENAGEDVGNAALKATQESLMNLKNSVASNMEFNPTITPVLDLSAIKKDSGLIGGMLTPPTLSVTDNYARASSLSLERRATEEAATQEAFTTGDRTVTGDIYNQYINSPKAVSNAEIYRNTKNLISVTKGANPT